VAKGAAAAVRAARGLNEAAPARKKAGAKKAAVKAPMVKTAKKSAPIKKAAKKTAARTAKKNVPTEKAAKKPAAQTFG